MTTLERSLEQRRGALEIANRIRVYRAQLKKDVAAGREAYDALLVHAQMGDPMLASMRLREALEAMPGIGRVKCDQIMRAAMISPARTFGGMTSHQWERLYVVLESYPAVRRRLSEARGNLVA